MVTQPLMWELIQAWIDAYLEDDRQPPRWLLDLEEEAITEG